MVKPIEGSMCVGLVYARKNVTVYQEMGRYRGRRETTHPLSVESSVHLHHHHEDVHFLGRR